MNARAILSLMILAGCMTVRTEERSVVRPVWVETEPTPSGGDLFIVGSASGVASIEAGKQLARHHARMRIANNLAEELTLRPRLEASAVESSGDTTAVEPIFRDLLEALVRNMEPLVRDHEFFVETIQGRYEKSYDVRILAAFPHAEGGVIMADSIREVAALYSMKEQAVEIVILQALERNIITGS